MKKKIVVLADGCFDPMHSGHLEHLMSSKKLGSYLIVNTNPDSVIWKKRPLVGPFLTANERKSFIKSLPFVDEVTSMMTVQALGEIKPDIYVQGLDWKETLPGNETEICEKLNITIHYTNVRINSSTKILNRFIKQYKNSQKLNIYKKPLI